MSTLAQNLLNFVNLTVEKLIFVFETQKAITI